MRSVATRKVIRQTTQFELDRSTNSAGHLISSKERRKISVNVGSKKLKLAYLHLEWGCAGNSLRSPLQELARRATYVLG